MTCSAGGGGSIDMEGRAVAGWGAAEAIGSVRGAVSGVGVGWAELRIAVSEERESVKVCVAVVLGLGRLEVGFFGRAVNAYMRR